MYKKIYLEITNNCNLNCSFCLKNNRKKEDLTIGNYKYILSKLKGYTNYLYLHVSGEPLMHPDINELINIGSKDYNINITTNGYLINRIKDNHNIRQINISMHSYDSNIIDLDAYLNNIINVINNLHDDTYISLRFWVTNKDTLSILDRLSKVYNKHIELKDGFNIIKNVYIGVNEEFVWPTLNNNLYKEFGKCYALKDHIGILSNGTVVPCCLDVLGTINLGNIYEENLEDIINSERYVNMINGFKCNKKEEELCRHCNFIK